jgi:cytochrome c553
MRTGLLLSGLLTISSHWLCSSVPVYAADQASSVSVDEAIVNQVLALSDDRDYGEYLAGECSACHSVELTAGSNIPVIHGASAARIARALLEYRSGIRDNSTMGNIAGGLADDEIAMLAHYFSVADQ